MRKNKITLRAGFTLNVERRDLTEYGGLTLWSAERSRGFTLRTMSGQERKMNHV